MLELIIVGFVVLGAAVGVGWRLWRCCTRRSGCPGCGTCPLALQQSSKRYNDMAGCSVCHFVARDRVIVRGKPRLSRSNLPEHTDQA
jgi:hypothetical protein